MKKLISTLLFLSLFVFPSLVQASSFLDLSSTHPNYVAIETLVEQGVVVGFGDNTFRPNDPLTRAQAVTIILLGLGKEVQDSGFTLEFSDVSESDWFYSYVGTAEEMGIIKGYQDGTFKPNQTVNLAEAATMLFKAAEVDLGSSNSQLWFELAANYSQKWNIRPVQADGDWHAEQAMTRGEMSEILVRFKQVQESGEVFDDSALWPRVTFSDLGVSMKMPFGWDYEQNGFGMMWLIDAKSWQKSPLEITANSSTIYLSLAQAHLDMNFNSTFAGLPAQLVEQGGGVSQAEVFEEWFIKLGDSKVLHLKAMRGVGAYKAELERVLELILSSFELNVAGSLGDAELLEALRSGIQVDAAGQQLLDLVLDKELIETDAIGVGTGPVDYYYSASLNVTLKYERSFDVILDLRDGRTTAF